METEFVQIGDEAFNVASIDHVDFSRREESVRIDYASTKTAYLKGLASLAFKEWWAKKACVYHLAGDRVVRRKQHKSLIGPAEVNGHKRLCLDERY